MQRGDDAPTDQAAGLGRGVEGIARFLTRDKTDIILVLGDRIEALAGALAGVTTGIVVAHIHGGDVALGDFDDSLRHAITKLAHVHFAATRAARRRILRMGEEEDRVHQVGAIGLDRLREVLVDEPPRNGRSGEALVAYHAWGRAADVEQRTMTRVLSAVRAAGLRRTVFYPNTDRGHRGVLRAIEQHAGHHAGDQVRVVRSLPRDEYLRALIRADVLVGNSSSGIIEAPLAGTPVVNVGARQAGREPGGPCVIECDESAGGIRAALDAALKKRPRRGGKNIYGDGQAGVRIAEVLAEVPVTGEFARKLIAY
jgi:UDP-hydrolysing UDP-N-acetyl-D-glucosamine 2-epimerase